MLLNSMVLFQIIFLLIATVIVSSQTDCRFETPDSPSELLNFLNIAMSVELSTLPLYLTAMLSFKEDNISTPAKAAQDLVYDVMMDEMLHMALVSNIISSIFGSDSINVCYNIPYGIDAQLPAGILSGIDNLSLRPYSKDSLWTFIQIEAPLTLINEHQPILLDDGTIHYPFEPDLNTNAVTLTFLKEDLIDTIGELYDAIQDSLILLSESNQITFSDDDEHIQRECQYNVLHNNITQQSITSLQDALDAINLIKTQGEGYVLEEGIFSPVADMDDDDVGNDIHYLSTTNSEKTHFIKYVELLVGNKLISLQHVNETLDTITYQFIFKDGERAAYQFDYESTIYSDDNFKEVADPTMFNIYYKLLLDQLTDGLRNGNIAESIGTMYFLQEKFQECMDNNVFPDFNIDCPLPPTIDVTACND